MSKWHCTINGAKYGPVSAEELRKWVAEGRLQPADYVWCEGMVDWAQYNTIAELNYTGVPQSYVQGAAPPSNGMAVAGMVLGIISVPFVCLWPIGLICAIVGLCLSVVGKNRANTTKTGGGMAVAGIALACATFVLLILLLITVVGMKSHFLNRF